MAEKESIYLEGLDEVDIENFDPYAIPFQGELLDDIFSNFDFNVGVFELLLSGSVGSAKTIVMAHLAVVLCIMFPRNHVLICRKTLPSLKETLLAAIIEHMGSKVTFKVNQQSGKVVFSNRSKITCHSWADGKFKKARSLNISCAFIEELTENTHMEYYKEIVMRCGRLPHIPINFVLGATNPDSPTHPVYKYFFLEKTDTKKVYKSRTEDNPFLKPSYVKKLKQTMSKKEADRMLRGEWVEIVTDMIYEAYKEDRNFKKEKYKINENYPIDLMHDFNIGKGKPMSVAVGQYIDGWFHLFKEIHVAGARTKNIMQELEAAGIFKNKNMSYRVFGDAAGKNNDTRSKRTDYDIIEKFLANLDLEYELMIPSANPPIRRRHNAVNAVFENDEGDSRFTQYEGTEWVHEGWLLTTFKVGGTITEDDSIPQQHVTTAIGYWVDFVVNRLEDDEENSEGSTHET